MTKLSSRITAIAVLAYMAYFLILTVFSGKAERSSDENRELSKLPAVSLSSLLDGSVSADMGTYIADHFHYRSKWIKVNTAIRSEIGEGIVNGVYISDDMLLDAKASEREKASESAAAVNAFAERYSGALYVAAIPTSSGVYRERLPEYLDSFRESQQITDFYEGLSSGIKRIDAFNILKMLNENYIFYRNDTKWTSYGAYCVYRTVIQKLGFLPTTYDKYTVRHVTSDFRGNLYNRSLYSGTDPDILDFYHYPSGAEVVSCKGYYNDGTSVDKKIYDERQLDSDYMYSAYLGEDVPLLRIRTNVNNERRLLVIKDSYADCFIPFLIQHYSEIDVVSPEQLDGFIGDYIDLSDYEQALILFGIENLSRKGILSNLTK